MALILPRELEYMILDYTTFLEFSTLRKVCKAWEYYLLRKHYRRWYTWCAPRRQAGELPPPNPSTLPSDIHMLLAAGGFGLTVRLLPNKQWRIENYYVSLQDYLFWALGMPRADCPTEIQRVGASQSSSYQGYELAQISKTYYRKFPTRVAVNRPSPSPRKTSSPYLRFKALPCIDDCFFQPDSQASRRLCIVQSPILQLDWMNTVFHLKDAFQIAFQETTRKWNAIYGRVVEKWTFRTLFDRLCRVMVRDIWETIETSPFLKYENGESEDRDGIECLLYLDFHTIRSSDDVTLEVAVYPEFEISHLRENVSTPDYTALMNICGEFIRPLGGDAQAIGGARNDREPSMDRMQRMLPQMTSL